MGGSQSITVAIIGATSHIAKGLIYHFCKNSSCTPYLFARSVKQVKAFLESIGCVNSTVSVSELTNFTTGKYDIIINCIGIGQPERLDKNTSLLFRLGETYDNAILDYLETHPDTLYINMSSGAVYGADFLNPASEETNAYVNVNHMAQKDFYMITKIYSEAKHRALHKFNIVDIRVFAYFSRFINLKAGYFITDVISSVKNGTTLLTGAGSMVRDYVHPHDLFSFIERCLKIRCINSAFDLYSLKPATKFEILDFFRETYGLDYVVDDTLDFPTATGNKKNYYSLSRRAEAIGYYPMFTSLDGIIEESRMLLGDVFTCRRDPKRT